MTVLSSTWGGLQDGEGVTGPVGVPLDPSLPSVSPGSGCGGTMGKGGDDAWDSGPQEVWRGQRPEALVSGSQAVESGRRT